MNPEDEQTYGSIAPLLASRLAADMINRRPHIGVSSQVNVSGTAVGLATVETVDLIMELIGRGFAVMKTPE